MKASKQDLRSFLEQYLQNPNLSCSHCCSTENVLERDVYDKHTGKDNTLLCDGCYEIVEYHRKQKSRLGKVF